MSNINRQHKQKTVKQTGLEATETPAWPTTLRSRTADGRLLGTDGSVWVYRAVPLGPVADAKTEADALAPAHTIMAAYEELAALTNYSLARRQTAKGSYRQTHLLLVNTPRLYSPPANHPNAEHLRHAFGNVTTDRRVLLFGVRLRDKVGGKGGFSAAVNSVVDTLVSGATPLSDFDYDFGIVDAALTRAGLLDASAEDMRLANSWWNHGKYPDTPLLVHADHIHVFTNTEAVGTARAAGTDNCHDWANQGVRGQHSITFASVSELDLPFVSPTDRRATWITDLLRCGALVVSVRGQVEPGAVTRAELRRQKKRYMDDINERMANGKMQKAEQEEQFALLSNVEAAYSDGDLAVPTLAGASIVVGLNGHGADLAQLLGHSSTVKLNVMAFRQPGAMAETMLCSHARSNPNLHDLPAQAIACSGAPSLSTVGDTPVDRNGIGSALIGFTERDRQPVYVKPTAASLADAAPLFAVAGATGSGKSMLMVSLADSFTRLNIPTIVIDPKLDSDFSDVVEALGGQVASLDELATSDGIFDPLRFAASEAVGIEVASSMLMAMNPWGSRKDDMEVPIQRAIAYGVSKGATCIGEALRYAEADLSLPEGMIAAIFDMADSSPMFRAIVGVNPGSSSLRASDGITLIKVGKAHLDLPGPGKEPASINQRVSVALLRAMVFGSAMALAGRGGAALMIDEAWNVTSGSAGRDELERLGRLARSFNILPMLFTQRVTDMVNAGLTGYISRGFILPLTDKAEAIAACELFGIEPTPDRIKRIREVATMGDPASGATAPNWGSMRTLKDPRTDEVLRGTIAIYSDLSQRAVPVEIKLSKEFLARASTNPEDVARRKAAKQAAAAAGLPNPATVTAAPAPAPVAPGVPIAAPVPVVDPYAEVLAATGMTVPPVPPTVPEAPVPVAPAPAYQPAQAPSAPQPPRERDILDDLF